MSDRRAPPLTYREIARHLNNLADDERWQCACPLDRSHDLIVTKRNSLLVFEPHELCEHHLVIAQLRKAGLKRTLP